MTAQQKKSAAKQKKGDNTRKYDSAWKDVIEEQFMYFLQFFFPAIYEAIDFTKDVVFLSKELRRIAPAGKVGKRYADVLVKVFLKDGSLKYICIFIHIEVQGQKDNAFMERMYIYNYRSFDYYRENNGQVISLAILTDQDKNYRPDEYRVDLFGFQLLMKIPIVKIIDFKSENHLIEQLEDSLNPMAMVVNAQLKSYELLKTDDQGRFDIKVELIRQCYAKGYTKKQIRTLLKFIDWIIRLPAILENKLTEEIIKIEEDFKMPYVPSWERFAEKKGLEKGVAKKARETAIMMLQDGLPIENIAKYTGLSFDEIKKLSQTAVSH